MFSVNQLSEQQKKTIHTWAAQGAQLDDVQKKLSELEGIKLTYMETRLLALDLQLDFQVENTGSVQEEEIQEKGEKTQTLPEDSPKQSISASAPLPAPDLKGDLNGGVEIQLDQVARPEMMVSGHVVFQNGERASWYIDTQGRLGMETESAMYRPTEEDLSSFQQELQKTLQSL